MNDHDNDEGTPKQEASTFSTTLPRTFVSTTKKDTEACNATNGTAYTPTPASRAIRYDSATNPRKAEVNLPATANGHYYCFNITDHRNRTFDSGWYHYQLDNLQPVIGNGTTTNNVFTLTVTDLGSGLKSLKWGEIKTTNVGDNRHLCTRASANGDGIGDRTFATNVTLSGTSHTLTIPLEDIPQDTRICVRVEDNAGRFSVKAFTLTHSDSTTTTPPTTPPVTPTPGDDDDDDDDGDNGDDTIVVLPDGIPSDFVWSDNWRDNPYRCLDETKIRADNNQCLSGGSAWGQEVYNQLVAYITGGGTTAPVAPTPGGDDATTGGDDGTTGGDDGTTGGDDGTTGGDDGTTGGDDGTPATIEAAISLNPVTDSNNLTVSGFASDGSTHLTDFEFALYDGASACDASNTALSFTTVSGDTIDLSNATNDQYVCVRATDPLTGEYVYTDRTQVGSDPTTAGSGDGTTSTTDEDEGGFPWVIAIVIGAVILVVGGILVVASGGKKNQL